MAVSKITLIVALLACFSLVRSQSAVTTTGSTGTTGYNYGAFGNMCQFFNAPDGTYGSLPPFTDSQGSLYNQYYTYAQCAYNIEPTITPEVIEIHIYNFQFVYNFVTVYPVPFPTDGTVFPTFSVDGTGVVSNDYRVLVYAPSASVYLSTANNEALYNFGYLNFTWASYIVPLQCQLPTVPNGHAIPSEGFVDDGYTIQVTCDANYGGNTYYLTCQNGQWSQDPNQCNTCVTACNDPHFTGLDGVRYNFQGTPGQVFAILSDDKVQLNSRFAPAKHGNDTNTFLGNTCLSTCNDTAIFYPGSNAAMSVNGRMYRVNDPYHAKTVATSTMQFEWRTKNIVKVTAAGRWVVEVAMWGNRININHVTNITAYSKNGTHGVLGHTANHVSAIDAEANSRCSKESEGGCEVEGKFSDYEVHTGLCSKRWMHQTMSCEVENEFFSKEASLHNTAAMGQRTLIIGK